MSTKKTVVVSIGRNIGDEPMRLREWVGFVEAILSRLECFGLEVLSLPRGDATGQMGCWGGRYEDSAVFIAEGNLGGHDIRGLTLELDSVRHAYRQDAIGFIVVPSNESLITGV